ncbi:Uncharacterised protein [Burkholderia pseudomallei]|uniref:hypothetical protein n=1 Tax=Burkholderia pseudomallei TaxID=28450 RepID=UPI000F12DF22|nr:hypothetical protein [Burkholderia pseudomallei]MCD4518942.1 hypothetical protein [Burkholderia pseudomallei]CAJ2849146.1 Uncharacterised protein [Burkholderia pseudomallei]CAJ3020605.1 Uncharacterised protein [Burkholderia pseudomallei]CAJ3262339.1 Uncharacterised protein [Burkholderia pseudomallei]CAJ3278687.1 Uncharacterised protein [Burkholderia pseudomallei]
MAQTTDKFPSGSWGIGPLVINWNLRAGNEVAVSVSVLGVQIDELDITINQKNAEVKNDVSVLGLVSGVIGLNAVYDQPSGNGLYFEGQLSGPGFDTGNLYYCIIHW